MNRRCRQFIQPRAISSIPPASRERVLKISPGWPWKDAFLTCWRRLYTPAITSLTSMNHPGDAKEGMAGAVGTVRTRGSTARPAPESRRTTTPETRPAQSVTGPQER